MQKYNRKTKKFLVGYEIMTPEDILLLLKNEIDAGTYITITQHTTYLLIATDDAAWLLTF